MKTVMKTVRVSELIQRIEKMGATIEIENRATVRQFVTAIS